MSGLAAGFDDAAGEAQATFRRLLDALARPGRPVPLAPRLDPPAPLFATTAAACLTLLDDDTPVWLDGAADTAGVRQWLAFHCGAPVVPGPAAARFALLAEPSRLPSLDAFDIGTVELPDRSTTLLLQVPGFGAGRRLHATGPGIRGRRGLDVDGLPEAFGAAWTLNHALFPCGVDILLCGPDAVVGLPRTVRLEG